eukprot:1411044-Prymnesium_polylepis.1
MLHTIDHFWDPESRHVAGPGVKRHVLHQKSQGLSIESSLVCGDRPTAGLAHGAMRLCTGPRQRTRIKAVISRKIILAPNLVFDPYEARGGEPPSEYSPGTHFNNYTSTTFAS